MIEPPIVTGCHEVDLAVYRGDVVALCEMVASAPRARRRFHAVRGLDHLNNRAAIPTLVGALVDRRKLVSRAALKALARLGADEAGPVIGRTLAAGHKGDRIVAVEAAGLTGDPALLILLGDALDDRNHTVRLVAADSIAAIGTDAARPLLERAASDKNLLVREAGRCGLNALGKSST